MKHYGGIMGERINRVVYVCMGVILSASLIFMSCAGPAKLPVTPITPNIDNTNHDLKAATDTVKGTTSKIKDNAQQGLDKTPATARVILEPHWREILIQAGIQEAVVKDLERAQAELADTSVKAKNLEAAYAKEQELRKKAESDATKELRAKYTWISVACFGLLVISVVAGFSGIGGGALSRVAIATAVASAIGLALSIALVQTVALIPYIVGGLVLVGGGIVVYRFVFKNKTITTTTAVAQTATAQVQNLTEKTQALTDQASSLQQENTQLTQTATELVKTAEASKPFMSISGRRHVYGDGPVPGVVRALQSEHTRKFVTRVRSEMTNVAPSIPETIASDLNINPDFLPADDHAAVEVEAAQAEVMSHKADTKSVRARSAARRPLRVAGRSTVIVLR
jgi:hypothetical protein